MTDRPLDKFAWEKALRGADLTHAEYRVLINLSTYARGDLTNARPGLDSLCEAARVRPQTAKSALRALVAKGWLEVTERGGGRGRATVYALTVPDSNRDGERTGLDGRNGDGERAGSAPETGTVSVEKGDGRRAERGTVDVRKGGRSPSLHQSSYQRTTSEQDHSSRHLSNAGAIARVAEPESADEFHPGPENHSMSPPGTFAPTEVEPDPALNPMAWLDRELPQGGFWTGERARAQELLAAGDGYARVKYTLLRERRPSKPARRFGRRIETDAEQGTAGA